MRNGLDDHDFLLRLQRPRGRGKTESASRVLDRIHRFSGSACRTDAQLGLKPGRRCHRIAARARSVCVVRCAGRQHRGPAWRDWRKIGVAATIAPHSVRETVALARQYADKGYRRHAYFERLGRSPAGTTTWMHALTHFQAIVDKHYTARKPYRWLHMAAAAKSAATPTSAANTGSTSRRRNCWGLTTVFSPGRRSPARDRTPSFPPVCGGTAGPR